MATSSAPTSPTQEVRHLFPILLSNGYVPIPNKNKHCYLPAWPSIDVDEAQCRKWARQLRWPAIGLRVEPPLLAMDYDLPDPAIAKAVRDITPPRILAGLERMGNPPKVAFYLRMDEQDEPFYGLSTHRFVAADKTVFQVEAFAGGGGGKQMGSFGPHSHDEAGNVLRNYSWVGDRSPANVPIHELPVLRRAEVSDHLDACEVLLAGWPGLTRDKLSNRSTGAPTDIHDITEATVFMDADGCEWSYDEVIAEAQSRAKLKHPPMKVTGSFTNDPTSQGSARCVVHWGKQRGLSVHDFKTGLTHRPALGLDDPEMQTLLTNIFTKRVCK